MTPILLPGTDYTQSLICAAVAACFSKSFVQSSLFSSEKALLFCFGQNQHDAFVSTFEPTVTNLLVELKRLGGKKMEKRRKKLNER